MSRAIACWLALLAVAAPGPSEPAWVAKVPDFRSSWPEPLAPGTPAPDFTLADVRTARPVRLATARADRKSTLLLFVDESCGTVKRRSADLGETLRRAVTVEGAAVVAVFTRNLSRGGAKAARAFAEQARFPDVPWVLDDVKGRAETTLAYHVTVTPCAAVLDGEGRIAYFGLALAPTGSDLLPGILAAVAGGKPLDGPAARPPYG